MYTATENGALYNGTASAAIGNTYRTGNIRPSLTTSWEIGTDLRLFDLLGLEFTYYVDDNKDKILTLDIDPTTGFSAYQINAGKIQRKGFEASISANPFRSGSSGFNWDVALNFGRNRSMVVELADDIQTYLADFQRNETRLEHRVGKEWGMLVGRMWNRDEAGNVIIGSNGIATYSNNQEKGTIQPDYTGGLFNNLSYKGFNLSFYLDFQNGGLFHSLTKIYGLGAGLHENTVGVNDKGNDWRDFPGAYTLENGNSGNGRILVPGVFANGTPNNRYIPARSYFYTALQRDNINQMVLEKLREVRLGYELPKAILGRFIKGANFGVMVSNALLIYAPAKEFGVDPSELENIWYEGGQLPSTRTTGFNLRVRL